jgi:uncharacterized protein YegJ (DUF2314 family)
MRMDKKLRWHEWLWLLFLVGSFLQGIIHFVKNGYSHRNVLLVVAPPLLVLWFWVKRSREPSASDEGPKIRKILSSDKPPKPLISIVLLLREAKYLDAEIIKKVTGKAWNIEFDDENFIVGSSPMFIVKGQHGFFMILNFDRPYMENPEKAAEQIPELRIRQAVLEHRAWCSVDLLHLPDELPRESAYTYIGKLVAEFADEDCTAILSPETSKIVPYDSSLEELLRGTEPLQVFDLPAKVPVIEVSDDNSRMKEAVKEARRRWPEFVAAFEQRDAEDFFSVKSPISEGDVCEYMWVNVTSIEGDQIFGRLGNEPLKLKSVRENSRMVVQIAELNDWMYMKKDSKEYTGGFTVEVLGN